jgi:glycosyltransferase involved in cell wall biosynthesis
MIAHVSISRQGASQGVSTVVDQFETEIFYKEGHRTFRLYNPSKDLSNTNNVSSTGIKEKIKLRLKNTRIVYFIFMLLSAYRLVRRYKHEISSCKIIVCHDVFVLFFVLTLLDKNIIPSLYNHSDSTPFNTLRKNFDSALIVMMINAIEKSLIGREVSTVYSLSKESSTNIQSCLKFTNCDYKVINNFIVNQDFKKKPVFSTLPINIWMIGTICERKRQLDFFELLYRNEILYKKLQDITFMLYGPIDSNSKVRIEKYDFVNYLGVVSNVTRHFNNGDILLSVSSDEGLPMSMIEAASNGLIIVSTDVGGCHRICKTRYNGFLFDYNIEKISEVLDFIADIHNDSTLRNQLSRNSYSLYEEEFSQKSAILFWQNELILIK